MVFSHDGSQFFSILHGKVSGERGGVAQLTSLAGVSVPSTSKRQMVFAIGRCASGGNLEAAADILGCRFLSFLWVDDLRMD